MKQKVFSSLLVILSVAAIFLSAHARPVYLSAFHLQYGTAGTALDTCSLCHTVPNPVPGNGPRNPYGLAAFASGYNFPVIEPLDSDGDGFSNIQEITARTFPGDPNSRPIPLDAVPPTVTSFTLPFTFTIPDTSTTLTVPITAFTAADDVGGSGIAGFMVTESALPPSVSDPGWSPIPPAVFTFTTLGQKTLLGWAKDAAGNVSTGLSATVTIDLSPGRRFLDVPVTHFAFTQIDQIAAEGITGGCSINPPRYCPDLPITRAQMAVFIEASLGRVTPPPCTGNVFTDVTSASVGDVVCGFIETLADHGITGGCQRDDPLTPAVNEARYCPDDPVTREQMAVFIEAALGRIPAQLPTVCSQTLFLDVNTATVGDLVCRMIEDFAALGMTGGCGGGNYCPSEPATRAQMAVFLVTAPLPLTP